MPLSYEGCTLTSDYKDAIQKGFNSLENRVNALSECVRKMGGIPNDTPDTPDSVEQIVADLVEIRERIAFAQQSIGVINRVLCQSVMDSIVVAENTLSRIP